MRQSYETSIGELVRLDLITSDDAPATVPTRRPQYDDEKLGIAFFRTQLAGADLSGLTLPGLFFGRSEITRCTFRNSDLRMSTMCWNDFVDVDFTDACLADCDLRATSFERSRFTNADLTRALVGRDQSIELSEEQRRTVVWSDDEPTGG
jgi:uncharacterized protein YjbI with pentapeptide repeats